MELKAELLEQARAHATEKLYVTDQMAEEYKIRSSMNVAVLRLPIGHCELNPIELIWAQVKRKVAVENRKFTVKGVEDLAKKAISEVTAENWQKCIEKVIKVETEWWEKADRH